MLPTRSRSENAMMATPITQVPTSMQDLSHFHRTSFNMGDLCPFYHEFLLPGDYVNLSVVAQLRTPALYLPIMEKLEIHTAFFYVRYSAVFDGWKSVVKPNWSELAEEKVPYLVYTYEASAGSQETTDIWMTSIQSYFGIPVPIATPAVDIDMKVNALPFACYWKIWNDFYRDSIVQPEFGFDEFTAQTEEPLIRNLGLDPNWTQDYFDYHEAWRDENGISITERQGAQIYWPIKRNWSPDFYTAGTYEPQYSSNPVQIPVFDIDAIGNPMESAKAYSSLTGTLPNGTNALQATPTGIQNANNAEIAIDVSGTAGTIAQLRFAESMQRFLERVNRAGDRYRNHVREFYGTDPGDTGDYAVYIGSQTDIIPIGDVWATAFSNDRGATQIEDSIGGYAGRAIGQVNGQNYQYRSPDFGHLIGIINVQPRSSYHMGLSKYWTMETWEDIPQAQFAHIGDEEVIERELLLRTDLAFDHENQQRTWSYVPRYSGLRYRNDYISGELRKYYTQFHLSRTFAHAEAPPEFNGKFLMTYDIDTPRVMKNTSGNHDVYAWIWVTCNAIRPIPKYGLPML